MTNLTEPTEYVENVQCYREGNTLGIRFQVGGQLTEGYLLDPDLVELMRDELNAVLVARAASHDQEQ